MLPIILSGGAGTRLWPVSRETSPKPFMHLPDGQSLLAKTLLRANALPQVTNILTVTNRDYFFRTRDEYTTVQPDLANHRYLLEPFGRNTAPAVALAALWAAREHPPETVLAVLPADHLIQDLAAFARAMNHAASLASQGRLVTFGIRPTHPETGFGYIECGEPLDDAGDCAVRRFVEKPSLEKAREYLASGRFLWNSGMFCCTVGDLLAAFAAHAPEVLGPARQALEASTMGPQGMVELEAKAFAALPDISIDYAIMERAANVAVVPGEFDWSDIGSWEAVAEFVAADAAGNRASGEAVHIESRNTYTQSDGRVVATVGVDDLVIVDTADAVLVAHRSQLQRVKEVVGELKARAHEAYREHRTVSRPWGSYTVLQEGPQFKIKRIEVRPGHALSLQMHHHRSEHWIVVSGTAEVLNDERRILVRVNESTFIPAGHKHRLANPGIVPLIMIEVQSGEYLGEDDIVRFDDQYGRDCRAVS
ncbi:MAG: mannose-1-phosphate guanylyltransferase/mannose-6-phosphate isomerase [Betaproteobacteria bacterium]|nr:mannose-1-phosphate guanylyltransferase/mannose-6-phosphate isomerase [Betaproteobacteria bacterium]